MDKVTDLLKEVRGGHLLVEAIYFISGIFLLIILNYIFKPTNETYHNWVYFSDFQKSTLIFVLGYFIARICNEIGWAVKHLLLFIFRFKWKTDLDSLWVEFYSFMREDMEDIKTSGEDLSEADLDKFAASDTSFSYNSNRLVYIIILESILLGFVTVLAFLLSYKLLLLSFVLWLKLIYSEILYARYAHSVANHYLKNQSKDANSTL